METGASQARDLSRSGQPRRRRERRRQHLPNPVRHHPQGDNDFVRAEPDGREPLSFPVRTELLTPIVIEAGSELEVDAVS